MARQAQQWINSWMHAGQDRFSGGGMTEAGTFWGRWTRPSPRALLASCANVRAQSSLLRSADMGWAIAACMLLAVLRGEG
eukprot:14898767-Alexandrium_andersonii.AAC.1